MATKPTRRVLGTVQVELRDGGDGGYLAMVFTTPRTYPRSSESVKLSDFLPQNIQQESFAAFVADEIREWCETMMARPGAHRTHVMTILRGDGFFETADDQEAYTKTWLESYGRYRWALKMDRQLPGHEIPDEELEERVQEAVRARLAEMGVS